MLRHSLGGKLAKLGKGVWTVTGRTRTKPNAVLVVVQSDCGAVAERVVPSNGSRLPLMLVTECKTGFAAMLVVKQALAARCAYTATSSFDAAALHCGNSGGRAQGGPRRGAAHFNGVLAAGTCGVPLGTYMRTHPSPPLPSAAHLPPRPSQRLGLAHKAKTKISQLFRWGEGGQGSPQPALATGTRKWPCLPEAAVLEKTPVVLEKPPVECAVCFDAAVNTRLVPCGHQALCA